MLADLTWLKHSEQIDIELTESKEEGKCVKGFEERINEIKRMEEGTKKEVLAGKLLDELAGLPAEEGYGYLEPSDLSGIQAARPCNKGYIPAYKADLNREKLYNKIYGAWLGRCAGCLLGQPVEGWHRGRIEALLKGTENYPISRYMSSQVPENIKKQCDVSDYPGSYGNKMKGWINNVECMPEDDDTNYTIIGLKLIEKYGVDFTPEDAAICWLDNLPVLHLCTAERVAYRNLVNLVLPPHSADYRNPYREWIGAQIRADLFGYITPGNPVLGSAMAWRDASISHTKNGIYGEMFVAAMLSAAAVTDNIEDVIHTGLSMIPEKSRLYESIETVLDWKRAGADWKDAIDRIHQRYDEKNSHDWCHTIPNAMILCIGLLYGELDFGRSIGIPVMAGFDTDCNGATAGSIIGMILGADTIPDGWKKPLNNQLKSGINGFGLTKISEMAERTVNIAMKTK